MLVIVHIIIMIELHIGLRIHIVKSFENGKVILTLFVNEDQEDKYNVFPFHFEVLQFLLLIFDFVFFAGLKLLRWFHWKYDFT
jgi:hypothetical protein